MKRLLIIAHILFISCFAQSQNIISFIESDRLSPNLEGTFKAYKILKISEDIQTVTDGAAFTINYGKAYSFILQENRFLSHDYKATIKKENSIETKNVFELGFDGKYFMNENANITNRISLSIFENRYTIFIRDAEKEFYIEPLSNYESGAPIDNYIFYESKDVISEGPFKCPVEKMEGHEDFTLRSQIVTPNDCKTVELNMCLDYSFFNTYVSINGAINRTLEILNLTQLDFTIANGLAYDVHFKVLRHYVITCYQCNYWPSTLELETNHYAMLSFSNYTQMFDVASDIKVFWQAVGGTPYAWGQGSQPASVDCTDLPLVTIRASSIKNRLDTNLTRRTLSHEFGHNFGCDHGSANSIMGYDTYLGSNWDGSEITINNSLATSNCYYNCLTPACYNVRVENAIIEINAVENTINVSWLTEIGMEYKVRLFNFTTNTWSAYSTLPYPISTTTYTYNSDITSCSAKYKVEIVPVCGTTNGISQVSIFTVPPPPDPALSFQSTVQDETLCNGLSYTFVVNAVIPGSNPVYQWKINNINVGANSPSFNTSALQNSDALSCQITNNELCLQSQVATVTKTVTVVPQPCNLSVNQIESEGFYFFPNPVKDQFTVKSLIEIKEISIYNLLGQKIVEQSINKTETVVDFSYFPISTYLLKIEFEGSSKTIKVIKD